MVLQGGGAIARLRRHHQNAPNDQGSNEKGGGGGITVGDVLINVRRIVVFILLAFVVYSPFGTHWINNPSSATLDGWDENRTSASWDTDMWDWDFIDCLYFSMCTMTTVGYGDMPTLRQEMRIFTLFFGFIGVTVVAGSITVIADWFAQQGRKRFLAKQRALLGQAILVAEGCAAHTLLTPSRRPRKLSNTGAICTYMYLLLQNSQRSFAHRACLCIYSACETWSRSAGATLWPPLQLTQQTRRQTRRRSPQSASSAQSRSSARCGSRAASSLL